MTTRRSCGLIGALRDRDRGDAMIWGNTKLVPDLLAEGLVDELNVMIEPILLGGGKRIFPEDGSARPLELVETTRAAPGVLVCTYRRAG